MQRLRSVQAVISQMEREGGQTKSRVSFADLVTRRPNELFVEMLPVPGKMLCTSKTKCLIVVKQFVVPQKQQGS
jgi:hypothetical protein